MSELKRLGLEDCDEVCRATSVMSKSAVKTFGFVVEDFENVIKESRAVKSSPFNIEESKWSIKVYGDDNGVKTCNGEPYSFKVSAGKVGETERNENLSSELIEKIFTKKIFTKKSSQTSNLSATAWSTTATRIRTSSPASQRLCRMQSSDGILTVR